jgi:hypothetical protein
VSSRLRTTPRDTSSCQSAPHRKRVGEDLRYARQGVMLVWKVDSISCIAGDENRIMKVRDKEIDTAMTLYSRLYGQRAG